MLTLSPQCFVKLSHYQQFGDDTGCCHSTFMLALPHCHCKVRLGHPTFGYQWLLRLHLHEKLYSSDYYWEHIAKKKKSVRFRQVIDVNAHSHAFWYVAHLNLHFALMCGHASWASWVKDHLGVVLLELVLSLLSCLDAALKLLWVALLWNARALAPSQKQHPVPWWPLHHALVVAVSLRYVTTFL